MNIEGPHRELPKDNSIFDEKKHEKTVHKKGPLKGKETWIRKSAIAYEKEAAEEAEIRNAVVENPSWFAKLFGKTNKENFHSVLQEEALETTLADLNYEDKRGSDGESNWGHLEILGKYNGHNVELKKPASNLFIFEPMSGKIDGVELQKKEAKEIWKKLEPLLMQREKNRKKLSQTNAKLKTKRPVLEVLGKLPPKKSPELEVRDAQKQLGPKKEE